MGGLPPLLGPGFRARGYWGPGRSPAAIFAAVGFRGCGVALALTTLGGGLRPRSINASWRFPVNDGESAILRTSKIAGGTRGAETAILDVRGMARA